jgi:dTMP kinase
MFIVIEGTDGSGKATQSRLLVERLQKEGKKVEHVSFPQYSSLSGKMVRQYLDGKFGNKEHVPVEFAALLYAVDRYNFLPHLEKLISENDVVVCDRYRASNLAHQSAKIENEQDRVAFIEWLENVENRLPSPDVQLFLDLPITVTERLMKNRAKKDIHEEDAAYLQKTKEAYHHIVSIRPGWKIISCAGKKEGKWNVESREAIHEKIWQIIKTKI